MSLLGKKLIMTPSNDGFHHHYRLEKYSPSKPKESDGGIDFQEPKKLEKSKLKPLDFPTITFIYLKNSNKLDVNNNFFTLINYIF